MGVNEVDMVVMADGRRKPRHELKTNEVFRVFLPPGITVKGLNYTLAKLVNPMEDVKLYE